MRNSWGTTWGDGGYCYLPYADGLASIATQLQQVAAADGESDEEIEFVNSIVEHWQVS